MAELFQVFQLSPTLRQVKIVYYLKKKKEKILRDNIFFLSPVKSY